MTTSISKGITVNQTVHSLICDSSGYLLTNGFYQKRRDTAYFTLVNEEAIRDTNNHDYSFADVLSLTPTQIRQISNLSIYIVHSHRNGGSNANGSIGIYLSPSENNPMDMSSKVYAGVDVLPDGINTLTFGNKPAHSTATSGYVLIHALLGVWSSIVIQIAYSNVPTTGSISVKLSLAF